jgi:flagellar motility protein MotE (MotC chaperone)
MTASHTRRRARTGNVTAVLIGLFVLSAGIRLTASPLPALARDIPGTDFAALSRYPARDFADGADILEPLLADIESRKAELAAREEAVAQREEEVASLAQAITSQLAELEAAEQRLERMLAIARTAAETDVAQLVSVYEAMKPKDSARIFSEMSPDFAAGFLGRMQPEIAARVIAELDPDKAYSISVVLAGRNL